MRLTTRLVRGARRRPTRYNQGIGFESEFTPIRFLLRAFGSREIGSIQIPV